MNAADLCHRLGPPNGRKHPSVSIDKRRSGARSRTLLDQLGHVAALLYRDGSQPWQCFSVLPPTIRRIADNEDPWIARDSQIRVDHDPTCAVLGRLQRIKETRSSVSCRPDDTDRTNKVLSNPHALFVDGAYETVEPNGHPHP